MGTFFALFIALWFLLAITYFPSLILVTTFVWLKYERKEGKSWLSVYKQLKIHTPPEEEEEEDDDNDNNA